MCNYAYQTIFLAYQKSIYKHRLIAIQITVFNQKSCLRIKNSRYSKNKMIQFDQKSFVCELIIANTFCTAQVIETCERSTTYLQSFSNITLRSYTPFKYFIEAAFSGVSLPRVRILCKSSSTLS